MDGWTDGRMDGSIDRSIDRYASLHVHCRTFARGTQQNNQTQAAHAEYKVRFQPINDDNDLWPMVEGYKKEKERERERERGEKLCFLGIS